MPHDTLRLTITSEHLRFDAIKPSLGPCKSLLITREGCQASLVPADTWAKSRDDETLTVYGILGFIRLNIGWVAIVITDRLLVGRLNGHNIYKLANYRLITLTKSNKLHLSAQHVHDDNKYFSLIEDTLSWNSLYFSTTFDLTQSLQRQQAQVAAAQEHGEPLSPFWQRTDTRFFWNAPLAQRLMDAVQSGLVAESGLDEYILPVMCGFVDISQMTMNHTPVTFALISRRSRFRPGTRYNSRGIDEQGHVSNFVETEQIIQSSAKQLQASYVQVRGSIPLFWAQVVCVKYVPRLSLQDPHSAMTADAIRRHFDSLCAIYGRVVAVNLTNLVGYEAPMAKGFRDAIAPLVGAAVRHEDFDFHQECKKMRYDRVSVLVSLLGDELEKQVWFASSLPPEGQELGAVASPQSPSPPPAVFTSQTSVLRVNCMDCLDRTNVVQSVFARRALRLQLQAMGILSGAEPDIADGFTAVSPEFEKTFKRVWADNADEVSRQYSGTGALKTDYTRTGKRSRAGMLRDGRNSVMRYILNNFFDGSRQDGYDLLLGVYHVHPEHSPYAGVPTVQSQYLLLPLLVVLSLFGVVFSLLTHMTFLNHVVFLFMWSAAAYGSVRMTYVFGHELVDRPRLVPIGVSPYPHSAPTGVVPEMHTIHNPSAFDKVGKTA